MLLEENMAFNLWYKYVKPVNAGQSTIKCIPVCLRSGVSELHVCSRDLQT